MPWHGTIEDSVIRNEEHRCSTHSFFEFRAKDRISTGLGLEDVKLRVGEML